MKTKVAIITTAAVICLAIGAVAAIAFPDNNKSSINITSTAPVNSSIEEGLKYIKEKYPDLSDEITFKQSLSSFDKSKEYLEYKSKSAILQFDAISRTVNMIIMNDVADTTTANINLNEAKTIAISVVKKYKPDYDLDNMKLTVSEYRDYGSYKRFRFEWREYKNDIDIGNTISVELNGKGEFSCLGSHKKDRATVDTSAIQLSKDLAIEVAKKYLSTQIGQTINQTRYDLLKVKKAELGIGNNNRVCWRIELSAQIEDDPIIYYYLLVVDAENGDIITYARG